MKEGKSADESLMFKKERKKKRQRAVRVWLPDGVSMHEPVFTSEISGWKLQLLRPFVLTC